MLISKGNPMLMGCSRYKDGYNFTYEAECDSAALLIFDVHMKLKERIELDSSMKCGNIFSVYVCDRKLDKCFYCYDIDGLMYLDPYAKAITDCGRFGQTDEEDVYLAAIDVADYDWEDDRPLNYDYSDCIFYKMNVRGFTKSRTSKVKDKGTFAGIVNKIPYLKELGVTTIELQPAYEFDEIGRFPQLTDTIMSKYGAGTHYSVDKNTRKINYWGYVATFH
jgi:isoamylase